jgi:CheY-like chemotaxis protein
VSISVLIVDDEPDVEALFRQQFRRDLRAQRFAMDFAASASEMRPDIPVIMITAYGDSETKRKAIERGAEGLLTKPIDFALLREEIDARLERAS